MMRRGAFIVALFFTAGIACGGTLSDSTVFGAKDVRGAFMTRGMGARPVGMGEAFTAVADDASAVSWNPGGLSRFKKPAAVVMYDAAGEGMGFSYLAGAMPVGPVVAGAGLTMASLGSYVKRDEVGTKLGEESISDMAVVLSCASPHSGFGLGEAGSGVSLELVREGLTGESLLGLSVGTILARDENLRIGAALQHLGPSKDGFSLPAAFRVGGMYRFIPNVSGAVDAGYGLVDGQVMAALGIEASLHPMFALRAGYKWLSEDIGVDGLTGVTAGLGARLGDFGLDYAYQPFGELVTSHKVALTYNPR